MVECFRHALLAGFERLVDRHKVDVFWLAATEQMRRHIAVNSFVFARLHNVGFVPNAKNTRSILKINMLVTGNRRKRVPHAKKNII